MLIGPQTAGRAQTLSVEPTVEWWTSNSHFGNRFTGNMQPKLTDSPIGLLDLPAVPGPPRTVAVQLFRSDRQLTLVSGQNGDVQCQITYGAGGVSNTFVCDWSSGAGITLVCNTLRLDILPSLAVAETTRPYKALQNVILGATVGLNALPSSNAVCTAMPVTTILPGTFARAPIPDFSVGLNVLRGFITTPAQLAQTSLSFVSHGGNVLDSWLLSEVISEIASVPGMRIPSNAQEIEIGNTSLANIEIGLQCVLGI